MPLAPRRPAAPTSTLARATLRAARRAALAGLLAAAAPPVPVSVALAPVPSVVPVPAPAAAQAPSVIPVPAPTETAAGAAPGAEYGYDGAATARAGALRTLQRLVEESSAVPASATAGAGAAALRALAPGAPADTAGAAAALRGAAVTDPRAALALGCLLRGGLGVPRDDAAANHWFAEAVHAGGCLAAQAHAQLAHAHFNGLGAARDPVRAYRAAKDAYYGARVEACRATLGEGERWAAGEGLFFVAGETRLAAADGPDVPGALVEFEKGARHGEASCALRLALLFLPRADSDPRLMERVQPDPERGRHFLQVAYEAGLAAAQLPLGRCRAEGIGGAVDQSGAREAFERAVASHQPGARLELAARLTGGIGVARDSLAGLAHLRAAAAEGDVVALRVLGQVAFDAGVAGRDRARHLGEAAACWERAAAAGDAEAMHGLSLMHARGLHYPRDPAAARAWEAKAAAAGHRLWR